MTGTDSAVVRRSCGRSALSLFVLCAAIAASILAVASTARATATIEVQVDPPNPQVGEIITVRYAVRAVNEAELQITPLDFGTLELLSDTAPPQLPMMWGGGFMTLESSREYNVRAPRPGRYVLRGARVIQASTGRVIATHPDVVIVIANGFGAGNAPPAFTGDDAGGYTDDAGLYAPPTPPPDPDAPPIGDLLGAVYNPSAFIRIALEHARPYVGQQTTLRAWLYVGSTEASCDVHREPRLTGFWSESLAPLTRECAMRWFPQTVGGRFMSAGLLRRIAVFATQAGSLTIGGLAAHVDMVTGGLFRSVQRVEATSPDLTVEVREPPVAGRLPGYVVGTIGPIRLEAAIDRDQIAAGETATITVRATTDGSLSSAGLVLPDHVDGVRIRSSAGPTTRDLSTGRVVTTSSTEILVVPERAGAFELGRATIVWFDPTTERYGETNVALPRFTATGTAVRRDGATATLDPSTELRALINSPSLEPDRSFLPRRRVALAILFAPALLFGFVIAATSAARRIVARRRESKESSRNDPDALLDTARRLERDEPTRAIATAARALDRAVLAYRDGRSESDALDQAPVELREAVREARMAIGAARFAGADADAADVVSRVARVLDGLGSEA